MNIRQTLEELVNKKSWTSGNFQTLKKLLPTVINLHAAALHAVETGDVGSLQGVLDYMQPPKQGETVTKEEHPGGVTWQALSLDMRRVMVVSLTAISADGALGKWNSRITPEAFIRIVVVRRITLRRGKAHCTVSGARPYIRVTLR